MKPARWRFTGETQILRAHGEAGTWPQPSTDSFSFRHTHLKPRGLEGQILSKKLFRS
jgi:hypothetical protein